MRQIRQNKSQQSKRRGALTVEFALVVPVLFLFFFAQLEFSRANMIRNMITTACYEGARAGVVPGATADQVRATAQNILDIAGVSVSEITVTPSLDHPTVFHRPILYRFGNTRPRTNGFDGILKSRAVLNRP